MIWHFISLIMHDEMDWRSLKKIPPSKIEQNMFQVKINNSQPFKQYFEKIIEIHSCRFGKFLGYARMKLMRQNPALTMLKKTNEWFVNYACDTHCCDRYDIWVSIHVRVCLEFSTPVDFFFRFISAKDAVA